MPLKGKINCLYILGKGEGAIKKEGISELMNYLDSDEGKNYLDRATGRNVKVPETGKPASASIYRHGESKANEAMERSTPETPLTDKGVEQAKQLGEKLKSEGVHTIYHSDYVRSRQTADEAAAASGAKEELLPNSEEKRADETDDEFVQRVKDLKDKIDNLPKGSAVISHGLVMKAMDALDQTGGDVIQAAKLYRKLPFVENTESLKPKEVQNAVQIESSTTGVLRNEGIPREGELSGVGTQNEEPEESAPSRTGSTIETEPEEVTEIPDNAKIESKTEEPSGQGMKDIPEDMNLNGSVVSEGGTNYHVVNDDGGTTIKAIPLEDDNDTYAGRATTLKRSNLDGYFPDLSSKFHVNVSKSLNSVEDNPRIRSVAKLIHKTLPNLKNINILNKEGFKQALRDVAGFEDADFKNVKDIVPLVTKKGNIYGFVSRATGSMYIDGNAFNYNTLMHEGSHVFMRWAKDNASGIYNEGLKLMDASPYIREVLSNPFYIERAKKLQSLGMNRLEIENELRDEALAIAVGDRGERMAENIKPVFSRWLNNFWGSVKNFFGYGKPELENMTPDQISKMTYGEFADAVSGRLLKGKRLPGNVSDEDLANIAAKNVMGTSFHESEAPDFDRIWNAAMDRGKTSGIDGKDIDGAFKFIRDYFKKATGNSYDNDMLFDRLRDLNLKINGGLPISHIRDIAFDKKDPVSNEPFFNDNQKNLTTSEKAAIADKILKSKPKTTPLRESKFMKATKQVYNVFDTIHGEKGKVTKILMDKALGKMNALQLQHYKLLHDMKREFYKMHQRERIDFMLRMRTGEKQAIEKLDGYAHTLNSIFDEAFNGLSKISDINMIDNFFPQFWKTPKEYQAFIDTNKPATKSVEGPAPFLKQRMFDNLYAGITHGFEPVTTNPAIMAQLYLRNSARYQMAHSLLSDLVRKGLAMPSSDGVHNSMTGELLPEGFQEGKYSIFKNFARQYYKMEAKQGRGEKSIATKSGKVTVTPYAGKVYVPAETNNVLSSMFGKGLMNTDLDGIFRAVGNFGNHLNFMQLSLSGFHIVTTTGNMIGTNVGMGISDMLAGKFGKGAIEIGKGVAFPYAIVKAFKHYNDLVKLNDGGMYNDPGLKMLMEAGGRLRPGAIYRDNWRNNLLKNYSELKNGDETNKIWGTSKVIGNTLMAGMTAANDAIMEHWVPALKMQAFQDLAKSELERIKPATDMQRMELLQDVYTHVENRFGEMDYNRLYMNRSIKEGGFLMFRALGWTLGNLKEGAGAVTGGLVKSGQRLIKGQGLNPDTAFLLGLVATSAAVAGAYNMHRWGKLIGWKDFIGFRTGRTNNDGTPEYRVPLALIREWYAYGKDIPTYIKTGDIKRLIETPFANFSHEMSNKISPAVNFMNEVLHNKDYYGDPIFSHENIFLSDNDKQNYIQRVMDSGTGDMLRFIGSNIVPISFKGEDNQNNLLSADYWNQFLSGGQLLQKFGVVRAPMNFDRRTWQNVIMDNYYKTTGSTDFTFNRNYINVYNNILKGIANIKVGDEDKNYQIIQSMIDEARKQKILRPSQNMMYFQKKYENYYPNHFADLNPTDMLDILGSGLIPPQEVPKLLKGYSSEKRGTVKSVLEKYAHEHQEVIEGTAKYKRAMTLVGGRYSSQQNNEMQGQGQPQQQPVQNIQF